MSPAGDGATRTVSPPCGWCGAWLAGSLTVRVDDWTAFACRECADDGTADVPATCILSVLPRRADETAEGVA